MSGTHHDKPAAHDEKPAPQHDPAAPPVHVDTPEQAAARQLVETSQRVTHVAVAETIPPPSGGRPQAAVEPTDFSLDVLDPAHEAKAAEKKPATKEKS